MKKAFVKIISAVACCVVSVCACTGVSGESEVGETTQLLISPAPSTVLTKSEAQTAADALHELGLFNGRSTDENGLPVFELESIPNRHEAVTMLVRLLGKEAEAEAAEWTAPFTDVVEWARPYVGYAYAAKITLGTSPTTYGGLADTTASQYITFMLRTLGYSSETDFKWDAAWGLSDKIGMTDGRYNASTTTFTRGDMAIIAHSALYCEMTDGVTLYDYLVEQGAIAKQPPQEEDGGDDEEMARMPWVVSGRLPSEYTWEEYQALTDAQKEEFKKCFTDEAFEAWKSKVTREKYPWEEGGKLPIAYTWAEFANLTFDQQIAFQEWFGSADAFMTWVESVHQSSGSQTPPVTSPEDDEKAPDQYTWSEFQALTAEEQEKFQAWFGSAEAFMEWSERAKELEEGSKYPWNNGGKTPDKYTMAEFLALPLDLQEAFQEWFGSAEAFMEWMMGQ